MHFTIGIVDIVEILVLLYFIKMNKTICMRLNMLFSLTKHIKEKIKPFIIHEP